MHIVIVNYMPADKKESQVQNNNRMEKDSMVIEPFKKVVGKKG